MVAAQKEKTAAQEEVPVNWAHVVGLSGRPLRGYDFVSCEAEFIYLYILIVLTLKYKPLPRKFCTRPQSNCVR